MNNEVFTSSPLTPTQQGMLFHHLTHPGGGVDIEQIVISLNEELDTEAFQAAWNLVIARHGALRTRFVFEGVEEPEQRIEPEAFLSVRIEDWRQRPAGAHESALERLLDEERRRGIELNEAPCMRVIALRLGDARWDVLWTFHHMICDGRSFPLVLDDLFALYAQARGGVQHSSEQSRPSPRPHTEHAHHVSRLDLAAAEKFWTARLAGIHHPTPLPGGAAASVAEGRGHVEHVLDETLTARLRAAADTLNVSLNTFVQAAWALVLARTSGEADVVFGATRAGRAGTVDGADQMVGCLINTLPVRVNVDDSARVGDWLRGLRESEREVRPFDQSPLMHVQGWSAVGAGQPLFESLIVYDHESLNTTMSRLGVAGSGRSFRLIERTNYPLTLYAYGESALLLKLAYDMPRFDVAAAERMLGQIVRLLEGLAQVDATVGSLSLLDEAELNRVLYDWNETRVDYPVHLCIHELIEAQVERTPNAAAITFRDHEVTYSELNTRANRLAYHLMGLGVGPDVPVGVCTPRSPDLLVALLAIHKAGGAYLPLDPEYPQDRLAFMIEDAAAPVLITHSSVEHVVSASGVRTVRLDDESVFEGRPDHNPRSSAKPANLAYVIYTSGSTGKPKGVMIEHRNAVNFFTAMDQKIPQGEGDIPGTWLAVTSLSFDISVLELLYTLARGFRIVLHEDQQRHASAGARRGKHADTPIAFSLMYFSSADTAGEKKYRLLIEGAKFADQHGFEAVWTPERHFHEFGGLYPNPALTTSAVAMVTKNVQLRAGSVVSPLHHPARVAEEWAVADNLSNGRVGIAFASGWQPRDFVLKPEAFGRKEVMFESIDTILRLWRGEEVELPGPQGKSFPVKTLPRPLQQRLPFWLTAAGSPDTFRSAGELGAGVLTHLLGQSAEELKSKLAIYRDAWRNAGHPGNGHVTLMLHTFVGDDTEEVRNTVRRPMMSYLGSSLSLVKGFAQSWTAFKKRSDGSTSVDVDLDSLTEDEMEGLLEYSFERYFETSGLFGDLDRSLAIVDDLKALGIDEIACLIDFGVEEDVTLRHLGHLNRVRELSQPAAQQAVGYDAERDSIPAQIERLGVTHFQCTPSLASMLVQDDAARRALGRLRAMMVGGEALPPALAAELKSAGIGCLLNMYGPTETTIWSTVHEVNDVSGASIPIGRPIANTQVYVLDAQGQPTPPGVPGELLIGGAGVTRGYLGRPELTAERFVQDRFGSHAAVGGAAAGRLYRTGDLVRWADNGVLEFLGRIDHQVKIRGHRIELGEIEAALGEHPSVREVVVMAREDAPGDVRLVAYAVPKEGEAVDAKALREYLREHLPEPMVPSHFVQMERFPQTPNRKIDRKALPAPVAEAPVRTAGAEAAAPASDLEAKVLEVWRDVLKLPEIGLEDNFFDLGGHSLLAVKVHRLLNEALQRPLAITDLFRFPTVRSLSEYLASGDADEGLQSSRDRAQMRRQAMAARRGARGRTGEPVTTE